MIGSLAGSVGRITLQDSAELLENSTDQFTMRLRLRDAGGEEQLSRRSRLASPGQGEQCQRYGDGRKPWAYPRQKLVRNRRPGTGTLTVRWERAEGRLTGARISPPSVQKGISPFWMASSTRRSKLVVNGTLIVAGVTSSASVGQNQVAARHLL